ncbi:flagellar hook-associated protein FlgL [Rhodoferax sp. U2-2l]|uniref:flagellar hook-associated protein FlgL n=1 Tax=Rhodoferax sp. U2-2l TaxID=2884000 RepID=UPI001D09CB61|nr:flagellar hook-associated protein FlgL [Rhodoferax sp. U2-2l]MCB8748189.1 flagellar hook-associated protein FlgL [Rhodoferax sp. U2-2l]
MSTAIYRTSSANAYDNSIRNINTRFTDLSALQENLTSGKRILRASDDPTSAAMAERALTRLSRIATDQRALASQTNAIAVAESTLGKVTTAMQRFRDLVVSAGNGIVNSGERKTIAGELQGLRDQIFALANTEDSNGLPLFNALGSALKPFVGPTVQPQDYNFKGLPGQSAASDVAIPFALDGDAAFMLSPAQDGVFNVSNSNAASTLQASGVTVTDTAQVTGSTYQISNLMVAAGASPGQSKLTYDLVETLADGTRVPATGVTPTTGADYPTSATRIPISVGGLSLTLTGSPSASDRFTIEPKASVFSVMDDAIRGIGGATTNNSVTQAVGQALHNIDISLANISAVRGQAGELLNRADRISDLQKNRSVQVEADRARAEDLDMIQGLADFNKQENGYSVALQTYAKVQQLSLFDYIR